MFIILPLFGVAFQTYSFKNMNKDRESTIFPEQIYNDENIYNYLTLFYLEDHSDPYLFSEIEKSFNPRWTISQYMASWLPYEKHYPEILQKLNELAAAGMMEADA